MIPLTKEENKSLLKKSFVQIMMMKMIKTEKRLKITAVTQKSLEELPIASAI